MPLNSKSAHATAAFSGNLTDVWSTSGQPAASTFFIAAEKVLAEILLALKATEFAMGTVSEIISQAQSLDADHLRVGRRKLRPYADISVPAVILCEAVRRARHDTKERVVLAQTLHKKAPRARALIVTLGRLLLEAGDSEQSIVAAKASLALESSCPISQDVLFDAYVSRDGRGTPNADIFTGELGRKFCSIPFDYLAVVNLPDIGGKKFGAPAFACACCGWLPFPIADLATVPDWETMWNSQEAQEIRRSILDGDYSYCSRTLCPFLVQNSLPEAAAMTEPHLRAAIDNRELIRPEAPRTAQLSHDQSCNLACPSCRTEVIVAKSAQRAGYDAMAERVLLPMMTKMNGTVAITGMGDPFGSKHYRSLVGQLDAQRFPGLGIDFVTNAQLLTAAEWNKLGSAQALVKSIRISIDAASAETYEDVRRPGKWDILMRNLDMIADLRRTNQISFFQICFVVQKKNYREMPDFVRLGERLGVDNILFQKLWNFGSFDGKQFDDADVVSPYHPLHDDLKRIVRDPLMSYPIVNMFNASMVATLLGDAAGVLKV